MNNHIQLFGGQCAALHSFIYHWMQTWTPWYMHATDILEITMMSSCLGLVFYPMHACTLLSIHKMISYSLLDGTVYQAVCQPIGRTVWIQLCTAVFAFGFKQSTFFPSHTRTLSVILALSTQYLSYSLPSPLSLSLYEAILLSPGSDVNALPIRLSIKQTCTTSSSGRPNACMQMSSNYSAPQTPWNLHSGRT